MRDMDAARGPILLNRPGHYHAWRAPVPMLSRARERSGLEPSKRGNALGRRAAADTGDQGNGIGGRCVAPPGDMPVRPYEDEPPFIQIEDLGFVEGDGGEGRAPLRRRVA